MCSAAKGLSASPEGLCSKDLLILLNNGGIMWWSSLPLFQKICTFHLKVAVLIQFHERK
jgi:hypothetical protein